uniref:Reverse transcriptase domain-containing protein n=1 Tax=Plectus sambesii TaxID=2011161 RepID=A0A914WA90_9BILA
MKNQKAPGLDNLPADVWKLRKLLSTATTWLMAFFNAMVDSGRAPVKWATSITVPIFKNKGDPAVCSNYRLIRLLSHTMKIFERIFNQRLRDTVQLSINQCGFVKGSGTKDAIFAARLLLEKHREKRKPLHVAFLDLEKAFDRVLHQLIWYALRDHGVPELLIDWVRMLYTNANSHVRCPVGTFDSFPVNVGMHQGSALSPLLFVLVMDTITRDLQRNVPWTLLYADDLMLAAPSREELQQQVQTEYLETSLNTGSIQVSGKDLTKTDIFQHLGSDLQNDGGINGDVRARVNATWIWWREVAGVLCDKKMPIQLKSKIYRTVVRPVALYGTECWPATKVAERRLHAMEMRMARWSLGISLLDHIGNDLIRRRMGIAPIDEKMRERRLQWYGHVLRAAPDTVASIAYHLEFDGQRPRGRPKQRWQDTINADIKIIHLCSDDALDRAKWRSMIRKADPASAGQR